MLFEKYVQRKHDELQHRKQNNPSLTLQSHRCPRYRSRTRVPCWFSGTVPAPFFSLWPAATAVWWSECGSPGQSAPALWGCVPNLAGRFSHSTAEEAVSSLEEEEKVEEEEEGALYTVNTPDCSAAPLRWKDDVGRLSFRRRSRDFVGCFQSCTFPQGKEVKARFSPNTCLYAQIPNVLKYVHPGIKVSTVYSSKVWNIFLWYLFLSQVWVFEILVASKKYKWWKLHLRILFQLECRRITDIDKYYFSFGLVFSFYQNFFHFI